MSLAEERWTPEVQIARGGLVETLSLVAEPSPPRGRVSSFQCLRAWRMDACSPFIVLWSHYLEDNCSPRPKDRPGSVRNCWHGRSWAPGPPTCRDLSPCFVLGMAASRLSTSNQRVCADSWQPERFLNLLSASASLGGEWACRDPLPALLQGLNPQRASFPH